MDNLTAFTFIDNVSDYDSETNSDGKLLRVTVKTLSRRCDITESEEIQERINFKIIIWPRHTIFLTHKFPQVL